MGETTINVVNGSHHVVENAVQLLSREREKAQAVVKGKNSTDVVAGDGACRKAGTQLLIARRSVRTANTVLINAADGIANAATIFDRHQHAVVETAGVVEVGIGGEVAGVGLLGANAVRIAGLTGS